MKPLQLCILVLAMLVVAGCDKEEKTQVSVTKQSAVQNKKQTYLLFVKIPDPVMPLERGKKYEDPLHEFLVAEGLGEVTGGGSMLSEPDEAGKRTIAWVGVDVDVYDPNKAMPKLVNKLKEIGVPPGTEIEQSKPIERTVKVN